MKDDEMLINRLQAEKYVSTLRPAMATTRYTRAQREQEEWRYAATRKQRADSSAKDRRQAGEGAATVETPPAATGMTRTGPTAGVSATSTTKTAATEGTALYRAAESSDAHQPADRSTPITNDADGRPALAVTNDTPVSTVKNPESPNSGGAVTAAASVGASVVNDDVVATPTTADPKECNRPVKDPEVDDDSAPDDEQVVDGSALTGELLKARQARRRKRRMAKRRRTREKAAERRVTQDKEANRKREEVVRQIRRARDAEEALKRLNERGEEARANDEGTTNKETKERARVSLVKQLSRSDEQQQDEAETVEYIGAEDGLPTATVTVAGTQKDVKLDSCARYTIAGTDWMALGDKISDTAPVDYVEGIGGFLLDVIGVWSFDLVSVFGEQIRVEACIVAGCTDEFLLGIDFLQAREATMDFSRNDVRYNDDGRTVVIPFRTNGGDGGRKVAAVRVAGKTKIAARTVTPVEVSVAAKDGERGMFIPTRSMGAVLLAATVTTAKDGKAWVPAVNANDRAASLPNKRELGTWIPMDEDMTILEMNKELRTERLNDWMNELGDGETPLSNEEDIHIGVEEKSARDLVMKLLRVYRGLSSNESDCPPATALNIQHHIDTGDTAPIMQKRRRQAQAEDQVINENVDTMLKAGVIEEGDGAWGFPVVLVKKKDGEVRFCVDYRALNKVTKKDVYPLSRIDETLEALGGALLFTTLDLKAGYWQILVAPEDRDKTAFTTKKGLYRFVRMPFGLTNAPSTFQRMMNSVLRGLTWSTCLVYLDDIVVFTRGGIERHIVELATVLERLATAGLTLKLKKCRFAMRSMEYLGHELSNEGVRPLQRLITAVQNFPTPRNAVEVKRFVHLAGYYRRFVECFGSLMAPMTKLLRKNVEWEWTDAQVNAFERVKEILTSKPLLVYPNFRRDFRVVTDASRVGLGACLMQDHGNGWQPVAYASKVNNEAESKYGITELECLAVVWAVKLFRPYLYGRKFVIITDHSALKWLMTSSNLTGKLHRWALTLQEFNFEVEYRPGTTNVVADALSRAPVASSVRAAVGRRRRARRRARMTEMTAGTAMNSCVDRGPDVEDDAATTRTNNQDTEKNVQQGELLAMNEQRNGPTKASAPSTERGDVPERGLRRRRANGTTRTGKEFRRDDPLLTTASSDQTKRQISAVSTAGATCGTVRSTNESASDTMMAAVNNTPAVETDSTSAMTAEAAGSRRGTQTNSESARPRTRAAKRREDERLWREEAIRALNEMELSDGDDGVEILADSEEPVVNVPDKVRAATTNETVEDVRTIEAVSADTNSDERAAGHDEHVGEMSTASEVTNENEARDNERRATMERRDERDGAQRAERVERVEQRRSVEQTLQLTDDEIREAQRKSKMVKRLVDVGVHRGRKISTVYGLAVIETAEGQRVILPPALWPVVFKEHHDFVWAGHLRAPHTYARIAAIYWWPGLSKEVKRWVRGCQECGSRKARPREVVPPLRSLRGGDVGDRWALDVAGPLPATDGGNRFVIAAVEYVTRYVVAASVKQHTAEDVASFLMKHVVLRFGAFRELLTDGAPEMAGRAIEELVVLLQAEQTTAVPHRPQLVGLVERFNRTWKDMVATYMHNENQRDWDRWVDFAVYSYNAGRHSTVSMSPNELRMGRRLRSPNELLRETSRTEAGELNEYHRKLVTVLRESRECAEVSRAREQERQARYYNRRVRRRREFVVGDRVWMYKPPRGAKATKLVHQWMGPLRIVEPAGYDNFLLEREDVQGENERIIAHVSFLVSYYYPADFLKAAAADIDGEISEEDDNGYEPTARAITGATAAAVQAAAAVRGEKRRGRAATSTDGRTRPNKTLVELRRRKRRNAAGQYVLEYELQPERVWRRQQCGELANAGNDEKFWASIEEYERLFGAGRVVEDSLDGEGV